MEEEGDLTPVPAKPDAGFEDAQRAVDAAGIPLPPIPERFRSDLRTIAAWCFASRKIDPMSMYSFDFYLVEALMGRSPEYIAFCHAGHGINSYALSYHLVDEPLVLMVQAPFGGVYMDEPTTRRAIAAQFDRCAALLASIQKARGPSLTASPGHLIVFESLFRGVFAWGWLHDPLGDEEAAGTWLEEHRIRQEGYGGDEICEANLPTHAARAWIETTFK